MTCLKCSYAPGEPKGARVCRKCSRPENVPKHKWGDGKDFFPAAVTLADLIGEEPAGLPVLEALDMPDPTPAPLSTVEAASEALRGADPSAPNAEPLSVELPAHSPYGGSAAKRFINCGGSVGLIKRLRLSEDETEYAAYGTAMHALAHQCLLDDADAWEHVAEYPVMRPEDASAVQDYLDYVRKLPGRKRYEHRHHRPELHPLMFGTVDCEAVPVAGSHSFALEIVDLKGGEGVYVEVENNEQGLYYAALVIMEDPTFFNYDDVVRITIAQPRLSWLGDSTIRSWDTTVEHVLGWMYSILLPAMNEESLDFALGDWCQFCPAKTVCPKMAETFDELLTADNEEPVALSNEELGRRLVLYERIKTYGKALGVEAHRRMMDRIAVPGIKLVRGKADRVWKDDAEVNAKERYGNDAYTVPQLLSPAQLEKLPGGGAFVAEWAFKPEAGYTVALESDKRSAAVPKSGAEMYANIDPKLLDSAGG